MINRVYKTEDGGYGTIPDGDPATLKEIIEYEISKRWHNIN